MYIYDNELKAHKHMGDGSILVWLAEFGAGMNEMVITELTHQRGWHVHGVVTAVTTLPLDLRGIYAADTSNAVKRFATAMLSRVPAQKVNPSNDGDYKAIEMIKLIASRDAIFINREINGIRRDKIGEFKLGTLYTPQHGWRHDKVMARKLFSSNSFDSLNRSAGERYGCEYIDIHNKKLFNCIIKKFGEEWVPVPTIAAMIGLNPDRKYTMSDLEKASVSWLISHGMLKETHTYDDRSQPGEVLELINNLAKNKVTSYRYDETIWSDSEIDQWINSSESVLSDSYLIPTTEYRRIFDELGIKYTRFNNERVFEKLIAELDKYAISAYAIFNILGHNSGSSMELPDLAKLAKRYMDNLDAGNPYEDIVAKGRATISLAKVSSPGNRKANSKPKHKNIDRSRMRDLLVD